MYIVCHMTAWENKRNQNHHRTIPYCWGEKNGKKKKTKKDTIVGPNTIARLLAPILFLSWCWATWVDPWPRANIGVVRLWGLWGGNNTFARCTRMHCRVAFWGPAKLSGLSRTCKFDFSKDTFQLSAGSDPFWSGLILDWSWSLFSPALQPSKQREVWYERDLPPPKESQAPEAPSGRAWGRWRGRARSRWWTGSRSCPEVRFLRERETGYREDTLSISCLIVCTSLWEPLILYRPSVVMKPGLEKIVSAGVCWSFPILACGWPAQYIVPQRGAQWPGLSWGRMQPRQII